MFGAGVRCSCVNPKRYDLKSEEEIRLSDKTPICNETEVPSFGQTHGRDSELSPHMMVASCQSKNQSPDEHGTKKAELQS